jgi:hypothetical protein
VGHTGGTPAQNVAPNSRLTSDGKLRRWSSGFLALTFWSGDNTNLARLAGQRVRPAIRHLLPHGGIRTLTAETLSSLSEISALVGAQNLTEKPKERSRPQKVGLTGPAPTEMTIPSRWRGY